MEGNANDRKEPPTYDYTYPPNFDHGDEEQEGLSITSDISDMPNISFTNEEKVARIAYLYSPASKIVESEQLKEYIKNSPTLGTVLEEKCCSLSHIEILGEHDLLFAVSVFDDAGNLQNVMGLLKEENGEKIFPYIKVELKPGQSSADVDWVAVEKQFHVSTELNLVSLAFQNRLNLTDMHSTFLQTVLADVKQVDEQLGRLAPDLVKQFQVWKNDAEAFLGQLPRFQPRYGHFGRQRDQLIALKDDMDRFIKKELVGAMMDAAERHERR